MKNLSACALLILCFFFNSIKMLLTEIGSERSIHLLIGGTIPYEKGDFPFQVSFQKKSNDNKHFCGGSIVHENFILTAAHCVSGKDLSDIRVVAGITNLKKDVSSKTTRNIADVFVNPEYHKPLPKDNDIALVKVDRPFAFNGHVDQVALPSPTYQIITGQKVFITGWGIVKTNIKSPSTKLRKIKVKVLKHAKCEQKYKGKLVVGDAVFCTLHDDLVPIISKGVCDGDSGGPVTIDKTTLVGVIKGSYHGSPLDDVKPKCGSKKFPDMHTEVSKYRDWIDRTIASNS